MTSVEFSASIRYCSSPSRRACSSTRSSVMSSLSDATRVTSPAVRAHGVGTRADPAQLAVGTDDPEVEVLRAGHRVASGDDLRAIVGVDELLDELRLAVQPVGRDPEDRLDRGARVEDRPRRRRRAAGSRGAASRRAGGSAPRSRAAAPPARRRCVTSCRCPMRHASPSSVTGAIEFSTTSLSPRRVVISISRSRTAPCVRSSSSACARCSGPPRSRPRTPVRPMNSDSSQPSRSRHALLASRMRPSSRREIAVGIADAFERRPHRRARCEPGVSSAHLLTVRGRARAATRQQRYSRAIFPSSARAMTIRWISDVPS